MHLRRLLETAPVGLVPLARIGIADAFGRHQRFGPHGHIGHIDPGGDGEIFLVPVIPRLRVGIRDRDLVRKARGGHENIIDAAPLAQEIIAVARLVGVAPDRGRHQGEDLAREELVGKFLFVLGGTLALRGQHAGIGFGVETAGVVLKGADLAHGLAQLQRRHGNARALRLLEHQRLPDEVVEHAAAQMVLDELLARQAGIGAQEIFLGIAVGAFKLLRQNGLAIHHGHHVGVVPVIEVAHAPEDEDKDDDAECHLDAEGLRAGADIIKHGGSRLRPDRRK